MDKRGLIILSFAVILTLFLCNFAKAAENVSTDNVNNAYKCLEDQIKNKTLSLKEAVFSALALGSKGNIVSRIESDRDANSCWPKGACKMKESAQVALAYNRMGKDSAAIKKWILSKNASATELKWLLEIDITNKAAASCTIKEGGRTSTIRVLENSRLQGSPGSCFSIDSEGFMLRINNNCLGRQFEISCDQDFVTSVLYQRTSGGTLFILPETHSAASLGSTREEVNGKCFRTGSTCDYEGTLWAALALKKIGEDVSDYMPYLLALADDNNRYFPSTFLYILVGGDDQYNLIVQEQKQSKFWEMTGTVDGRYYDTSLAMLALGDKGGAEIDATKSYLLSIQTNDGCWNSNNIRDTGFLLYSGWPRGAASAGEISPSTPCEPTFSCENAFECTSAGGTIEYNYECPNIGQSCCSIKLQLPSCAEKQGLLCPYGTECSGRSELASDGACCLGGSCTEIQVSEDTCTPIGGICKTVCGDNEEESAESCLITGDKCCIEKAGTSIWVWIILLLILIAIVVLGIIYRDKVKIWWFKIKERFKKKPVQPSAQAGQRSAMPYAPTRPMMQPRAPIMQRPVIRPYPKDKEMEEALRKLREMSKK
jgi:competence protein ComGC